MKTINLQNVKKEKTKERDRSKSQTALISQPITSPTGLQSSRSDGTWVPERKTSKAEQ